MMLSVPLVGGEADGASITVTGGKPPERVTWAVQRSPATVVRGLTDAVRTLTVDVEAARYNLHRIGCPHCRGNPCPHHGQWAYYPADQPPGPDTPITRTSTKDTP